MTPTKKAVAFLLITFGISWIGVIVGWAYGLPFIETGTDSSWGTGSILTKGPPVAALICVLAFERDRWLEALGLFSRPNWWWLAAGMIALAFVALSIALTVLLSDRNFVGDADGMMRAGNAIRDPLWQAALIMLPRLVGPDASWAGIGIIVILMTVTSTLTEEVGWRGYLHYLWRPFGFWRTSFATGFIWGLWHVPPMLLYGLTFRDHPLLGVLLYPFWTMLLAPFFTLLRDRGGSIWVPGIAHGVMRIFPLLSVIMIDNPDFPWAGAYGIGGFAALAIINLAIYLLKLDRFPQTDRPAPHFADRINVVAPS